jgi:hypothetical protein
MIRIGGVLLVLPALLGRAANAPQNQKAQLVEVQMIWGRAPHNGFTDLVRFHDRWYCAFREGRDNMSPDGALRVLTSADGETWASAALLSVAGADLRDPKLSVTPYGRLLLNAGAALQASSLVAHQSLVWSSADAREWSGADSAGDPDVWLWRVTWHLKQAYSVGYSTRGTPSIRLYTSGDGSRFNAHSGPLVDAGESSEASLLFLPDGSALCLLRRGGAASTSALGKSRAPYRGWSWTGLKAGIAGPNLIRLPDERIVVSGGMIGGDVRTSLSWLDPETETLTEFLTLPSGGDNGYPGMVFHDGLLWVSYYSSHEGRAMIYLAKVKLPPVTLRKP